jgi:dipeptidase D
LEPRRVFFYFEEICKIPHGSGNEKALSDWIVVRAESQNLWVVQDDARNVIVRKAGTLGYESAPTIVLQGHIDMVCEKNKDTTHDFANDPLKLGIDGDYIHANGTTLGADNGAAVAMCLALMEATDIPHPPLEFLFTTEEETGMSGAESFDPSLIKGRKLINLDSEEEGVFCVSCAGGLKMTAKIKLKKSKISNKALHNNYEPYVLRIKGLKGGHSGIEIDKGRANSNRLMGRLLTAMQEKIAFELYEISGGLKVNAIPRESEIKFLMDIKSLNDMVELMKKYQAIFRKEYRVSDPDIQIELLHLDESTDRETFSCIGEIAIIAMLLLPPDGVQAMSQDFPGMVETSNNLGVVSTQDNIVTFEHQVRSSVSSRKFVVRKQISLLASIYGDLAKVTADYAAWEYNEHSALRESLVKLYEEKYGKKPLLSATHAGLECGILAQKLPGVDIISFGPDIQGAHTPDEKMSISSIARVWDFLIDSLTKI